MTTATVDAAETLPRWDLDSIFPGPQSPEFREAFDSAGLAITELTALFDRHGVGIRPMGAIDANASAIFDEVVTRYDLALEAALRLDGWRPVTEGGVRWEPSGLLGVVALAPGLDAGADLAGHDGDEDATARWRDF